MTDRRQLPLSFLDLLFILLLGLMVITMLKQPIRTTEIERKADFMIVTSWPDNATSDIDMWFRSPAGERLSYINDMISVYSLERDDLGDANDVIVLPDGSTTVVATNEEVISMRGWVEGTYTVNVHAFSFSDDRPLKVKVRFFRVTPYKLIAERELIIDTHGQEETAMNVTLDASGAATNISYDFRPLRNSAGTAP